MKAAVLGIGTELVDGQIVNKNASWISQKLKALGMQTQAHLVVPDEKTLMFEGIEFCAEKADLIFITGGLGPTSDDFTRDVVAQWAKKTLHFDQASWEQLSERLTSRNYVVKDIQKQQCYFPEGSRILRNPEGTANAFFLEHQGKKVFVLPGPPREIEAVWNLSIHPWLIENTKSLDPHITRIWDTLGVGESDIAVIVEEVLKGQKVEKGYRVHLPYVEVKMSYPRSEEQEYKSSVEQLTKALEFCTIARDGEDSAELFAKKLQDVSSISVIDEVTGQFLMNRLMPVLRSFMNHQNWSFSKSRSTKASADIHFSVLPKEENAVEVSLTKNGQTYKDILVTPYKTANMKERRLQYFAELALVFWLKNI